MTTVSWVEVSEDSGFGVDHLPYGVFSKPGELPRIGVAIGAYVLDLAALSAAGLIEDRHWFASGSLNGFMVAGRSVWQANRARLTELLTDEAHRGAIEPHLVPVTEVDLLHPIDVADYVDFYSSLDHATNAGRIFRPTGDPLTPNWKHLPVAYHGRSGTVYPSGTPIVRPCGQRRTAPDQAPTYGPCLKLDFEAEVGFVAGVPSAAGSRVVPDSFADHIFGFVLVNDWSARDIQYWESQPLGPFLGKSFATSISHWVTPLAALEAARVPQPSQDPAPLPYLQVNEPSGLDLALEVLINDQVISRPPFATM